MSVLTWDKTGDRIYEIGVDRGVLYVPDGIGIPWNGLTSVSESSDKSVSSVYYDGMKINDLVELGSFSGSMKAITYPDEFLEFEGIASVYPGILATSQKPKVFNLSYRTRVGNDLDQEAGYKIHIIYNVTAIPKDKSYQTISDSVNLSEFEWDIFAIPEECPGIRPTSHFIIDSTKINAAALAELEDLLYGTTSEDASLPSVSLLMTLLDVLYDITIIDHGDGTWTANSTRDESITYLDDDETIFQITGALATYLDSDTYTISDS